MTLKLIGAIMIIAGTSAVGFTLSATHRRTEAALMQVIAAVEFMTCELQFRLTPLPELCKLTCNHVNGPVRTVFRNLSDLLNRQVASDVFECMRTAIYDEPALPERVRELLLRLGQTLGRFDLQGQLSGLSSVRQLAQRDLDGMLIDREVRLRSYQTLGICAGVALAILFI